MTTVRLRLNGPYVIDGDEVRVIDWHGVEYAIARRPLALCRCGHSRSKPLCDGSHRQVGFDGGHDASGRPGAAEESRG